MRTRNKCKTGANEACQQRDKEKVRFIRSKTILRNLTRFEKIGGLAGFDVMTW